MSGFILASAVGTVARKARSASGLDPELLALATRDRLLTATEWIESSTLPIDRAAWIDYRDSLLCVTDQPGWPKNVVWPKPPR